MQYFSLFFLYSSYATAQTHIQFQRFCPVICQLERFVLELVARFLRITADRKCPSAKYFLASLQKFYIFIKNLKVDLFGLIFLKSILIVVVVVVVVTFIAGKKLRYFTNTVNFKVRRAQLRVRLLTSKSKAYQGYINEQ